MLSVELFMMIKCDNMIKVVVDWLIGWKAQ